MVPKTSAHIHRYQRLQHGGIECTGIFSQRILEKEARKVDGPSARIDRWRDGHRRQAHAKGTETTSLQYKEITMSDTEWSNDS